jgi:hypothetical protein
MYPHHAPSQTQLLEACFSGSAATVRDLLTPKKASTAPEHPGEPSPLIVAVE